MWFRNILRRNQNRRRFFGADGPLFDERFLRRLERLSLQAQRTLRGNPSSGDHPSRQQIPASIFSDHRPYTGGDDVRYVDWNAYARQEHLLLKLGEAEQDVHVHLLLDCSRSMSWGQPAKFHVARQMVGALGYLGLAHSDRVHLLPFGATPLHPFGPAQGKGRLADMLRFIEAISIQQHTDLNAVLPTYARQHRMGGILVICSDLLAEGDLTEALQALTPSRWQVLVLHILDPREMRPELQGPLELQDSETGRVLSLTLDADTLESYRRNMTAWRERIALTCARRGATYASVLTTWPLEQKIVPYLRVRRLLA